MTPEEMHTMSIEALLNVRREIDEVLLKRRAELERQLEQIIGRPYPQQQGERAPAAKPASRNNGKIAKPYRSKKDPSLGWSGRGLLPRWMRAEMKGTKLKKQDFLVDAK